MSEPIKRYHINVFWSDEDQCWIADAPDLRYCSAHGHSSAKAVAQLQEAMCAWLDAAREGGLPLAEPRYRAPLAG